MLQSSAGRFRGHRGRSAALGLPSRGCGVAVADSQESVLVSRAAFLSGILAAADASLPLPRQTGRHLFRQLLGQLLVSFAG